MHWAQECVTSSFAGGWLWKYYLLIYLKGKVTHPQKEWVAGREQEELRGRAPTTANLSQAKAMSQELHAGFHCLQSGKPGPQDYGPSSVAFLSTLAGSRIGRWGGLRGLITRHSDVGCRYYKWYLTVPQCLPLIFKFYLILTFILHGETHSYKLKESCKVEDKEEIAYLSHLLQTNSTNTLLYFPPVSVKIFCST